MESNSDKVKKQITEIENISKDLQELVYSAPSKWLWDTIGSAVSMDQIAETIEKIENNIQNVQQYCDDGYKEATNMLLAMMWSGLQTKNYEAILQAIKHLNSIEIDFESEPFRLKI